MLEFIWTLITIPFSIIWFLVSTLWSILWFVLWVAWFLVSLPFSIFFAILWPTLDVLYFLLPFIVIFLIVKHLIGDADLKLQFYEQYGKAPAALRGQVVWITGASSGIGEELAYRLARVGCKLVLSARREEELNRVKQQCLAMPGNIKEDSIMILPFDLSETEKHADLVQEVLDRFTNIDILVNNAARGHISKISETSLEMDREILDLLVFAQLSLTKAVLPHWQKRKQGHVVVTSSLSGKFSTPLAATYCLGKQGLHGYFEALRFEHSQDNIDVTMVCPGPVKTDFAKNLHTASEGFSTEANKNMPYMSSERCAELTAIAMANKAGEVWVTRQPVLFFSYFAVYLPDVYRWIGSRYLMKMTQSTLNLREE